MVAGLDEVSEMGGDLPFVPGEQDRLDVGKYLYSVARPMPVFSAMPDMVTALRPCSATGAAVASMVASRTARRCCSIVSVHNGVIVLNLQAIVAG